MYMGSKVISKQVEDTIPDWLQYFLKYLIETMDMTMKDPAQFFKLTCLIQDGQIEQRIILDRNSKL
jgi:pyridoxine/pyridoxamine 5'-phosphate oxidase